ncbi:hypothetical protein C8J56DRAFT_194689 [Mycena floridula]|nr:hypothetical protein C8J56DRAFT_194689 [Mycena floridula]
MPKYFSPRLWLFQLKPSDDLPPVYQTGVRDVEYITDDVYFDYLFNIHASGNDLFDSRGVPANFVALPLTGRRIDGEYHPKETLLSSDGIEKREISVNVGAAIAPIVGAP